MSKKINLTFVIFVILLLVSGCGKKANNQSEAVNEEVVTQESTPVKEETPTPVSDELPQTEDVQVDNGRDSKELYENFMSGSEPLYFDLANIDGKWYGDVYEPLFEENKPYTLDEVFDVILAHENEESEDSIIIGEVKYSYIDCGLDGESELAIIFEKVNKMSGIPDFQEAFIIKAIDDKLQLCFEEDFGYRSYLTIKNNGCMVYSGSAGAAYYVTVYRAVDKDGKSEFIYGVDTSYNPRDLFYEADEFDESKYESILSSTMYEEYSFREFVDAENYENYKKDLRYVYYLVDENYEPVKNKLSVYESDSDYAKMYALANVTFVTPDEITKYIDERFEKTGVTQEMLDADEVNWTILRERPEIEIEEETAREYIIENPSWEYILASEALPTKKKLKLTKVSQEANDITDDYAWFEEIGVTMPDRNNFSDQSFAYSLTGDEEYYPYKAEIIDLGSYHTIANLDFSNHRYADNLVPEDKMFVDEAIQYMVSDGFTLYVSVAHNTYASSASHNAYVMALDMRNDYSVLWKSQPLVANAKNFIVLDDFIVCGYGFTAEDDYLYILDKYTGEVFDKILLKTGPDYIYEINDKLYVRTYNTNYVFDYEIIE